MNEEGNDMVKWDQINLPWYTEGPVVDADGTIFFTTLGGGTIQAIAVDGKPRIWAYAEKPNGQLILAGGDHLVCDSGRAGIGRYDAEGRFLGFEIEKKCAGQDFSVPNDLVCDAAGGVYFTDSVRENGKVCYYAPDGTQAVVATGLHFPNGIALAADGKKLFIAESYKNRILVFGLRAPGMVDGSQDVFAELPRHLSGNMVDNLPDGIRLRQDGTLWVAHYGMQAVQVLDAQGKWVTSIPTGFRLTSNLCFHEAGLIVTGGHSEPGPGGVIRYSL